MSFEKQNLNQPLKEGVDYYIENGLYVFTAEYLLKRGYCCRNGCRHCPYGYLGDSLSKDTTPDRDHHD